MSLHSEIEELTKLLMEELTTVKRAGAQLAENEANYRKLLRTAILEEQANGTKVSVVSDVSRGREDVADARYARDCSEAIYKASQEAVNVYKLRMRMLNDELEREWHSQ